MAINGGLEMGCSFSCSLPGNDKKNIFFEEDSSLLLDSEENDAGILTGKSLLMFLWITLFTFFKHSPSRSLQGFSMEEALTQLLNP